MGVFFLFYRFDNKYTARGDQAIQGILYVPDDDSVHYLAREWEYYPDVLLTPQEIKEQKEDYYSRYVSIGEYGGMDMGDKNKSPFGSGTYRMTLVLPEKEKQSCTSSYTDSLLYRFAYWRGLWSDLAGHQP